METRREVNGNLGRRLMGTRREILILPGKENGRLVKVK